ncbi:polysaccharide lyase family 7 protein [Flavobacteriaceae bacterium]|nr:polysaccharide lyase family 7 protein [Flavobacteriaceae bacterium]
MTFFTLTTTYSQTSAAEIQTQKQRKQKKKRKKRVKLPKIDLTHWKVTLPAVNNEGKPIEIQYPEILNFASNPVAKPYMYVDSLSGSIVFHAMPTSSKTRNTKYTRSELREQMVPGENNVNWTFEQGGTLKAKMAMDFSTKGEDGKYHRTIIMQIHGRLTNDQRDLIGEDDNNAPPILKIYWDNGKIRVKTKVLKDLSVNSEQILHEDAWTDDTGFNFEEKVDFNKFTLEVKASKGKLVICLNDYEYKVYKGVHIDRWSVFENYFKVGNYFQTRDPGAFSKVKLYSLDLKH